MRRTLSAGRLWIKRGLKTLFFLILFQVWLVPIGLVVSAQSSTDRYLVPLETFHIAQWAFSPNYAEDGTIYIMSHGQETLSRQGIHRSEDRGDTWVESSQGIRSETRNKYHALAVSPNFALNRTLWLFGRMPRSGSSGPSLGMWESKDGGESWRRRGQAILDVSSVVVSPTVSKDGIMVASIDGFGVVISHDIGGTWEFINEIRDIQGIYAPPSFPAELFLAAATTGNQVKISTDGGKTFDTSAEGLPESMRTIRGIVFSQNFAQDRRMFCFGSGGIFESVDAGKTWNALVVPEINVSITALAVTGDFVHSGSIAYGTDDAEVYLSDDMGKTFHSLQAETLLDDEVETLAFPPDYAASQELFFSSKDGIFRCGPVRQDLTAATAEAAVREVESTRSAKATSVAGYHFVPKDPERVETGCVAYYLVPVGLLVPFIHKRRKTVHDQINRDGFPG